MNMEQMRERLRFIGAELTRLNALGTERTADDESALDRYLAEFNDLGPQFERAVEILNATTTISGYGQTAGITAPQNGIEGAAGMPSQILSVGAAFAQSEELKRYNASPGKNSDRFMYDPGVAQHKVEHLHAQRAMERMALISTDDAPAYLVPPMVVPGIIRPRDYRLTMLDVLSNGNTTADTIYFVRELLFTNAAAETPQAQADGTPTGEKPESSLTFEQDSAPVVTIASWVPITRQTLQDAPQVQAMVENRLIVGADRRLNSQVLNGDGTNGTITGILNTTGVQVLDDTYFGTDQTQNNGTDLEDFERVLRGITEVELTGDALATFIAMNPRDIERLQTIANDESEYVSRSPFNSAGNMTLWGLPVARERSVPEGEFLVGDGTMATVWQRTGIEVLIDTINDQFIKNILTILAEKRAALTVFRPVAFAHGEFVS